MNAIILIGFKHCGKTTVGKLISQQLDCEFIDTDNLIEEFYLQNTKQNRTVREIYTHHGEVYLRECERQVVESLYSHIYSSEMKMQHRCSSLVIATGGGTVLKAENVQYLKKLGELVYLNTPFALLKERAPQYLGHNFETIYNERLAIYPAVADKTIETKNKSILQIVDEILAGLSRKQKDGK